MLSEHSEGSIASRESTSKPHCPTALLRALSVVGYLLQPAGRKLRSGSTAAPLFWTRILEACLAGSIVAAVSRTRAESSNVSRLQGTNKIPPIYHAPTCEVRYFTLDPVLRCQLGCDLSSFLSRIEHHPISPHQSRAMMDRLLQFASNSFPQVTRLPRTCTTGRSICANRKFWLCISYSKSISIVDE